MIIRFCDHSKDVADAFQNHCGDIGEIYCQDIFSIPETDALISPANSYGQMHGGIDYHYFKYFGHQIEDKVQDLIKNKYAGELLVGEACIVETDDKKFPHLIMAPTMRVPSVIKDNHDVFKSSRAAMLKALESNMESIAFPGMGTLTGRVPPEIAAQRVKEGIESAIRFFEDEKKAG